MHVMGEDQATITSEVHLDDLNVGFATGQVILTGQSTTNPAIADLVVDRLDPERRLSAVVRDLEKTEAADDRRAQVLEHKAFVAIVRPGMAEDSIPVATAGNIRKPFPFFLRRLLADAMDVA